MQRVFELTNTIEEEGAMTHEVAVVAENGLGYGEGAISTATQLERGELTDQALIVAHELIVSEPRVFVAIDEDITDDGCGDGRPAVDTWVTDEDGREIHYNKSYPRAKLFGGGLVVASSMWRAIIGAPAAGDTVLSDRTFTADKLHEHGIVYGAHSDEHAHGDACGCGAIDKYPAMSRNVIVYQEQIKATLKTVYGDSYDDARPAIDRVFATYIALRESEEFFGDAAGAATMAFMKEDGAIIKKLGGDHQEDVIVLNDVEGTTFNQPAFDVMLKNRGIEDTVQAFVVDLWRGRMYADAVATIAQDQGIVGAHQELAETAYADFLIRTLAVAATLTSGDLPVYARMQKR